MCLPQLSGRSQGFPNIRTRLIYTYGALLYSGSHRSSPHGDSGQGWPILPQQEVCHGRYLLHQPVTTAHHCPQGTRRFQLVGCHADEVRHPAHNQTWMLVPRPLRANVVTGKWVLKHKFQPDSSFEKYKAKWVVCGFTHRAGVDFGETFAPVIKLGTVCTVLTIATNKNWLINQLYVSNAFLHGHLDKQMLNHQPVGFVDASQPDDVCSLSMSLYRLKQASRAWFTRFAQFTASIGFMPTRSDSSLFMYWRDTHLVYLLLYINDILTCSSSSHHRQARF
jgi:hypothetical protein